MQHIIRAKKSFGQNFLIDPEALEDIATSLSINGKHIIEVGPGYGALTDYLIRDTPATLDLIELDPDMISLLEDRYTGDNISPLGDHLMIHHSDVLKYTPQHAVYSVIANIPYYITSPILFHFLYNLPNAPEAMTIMMQKEVGEKILEGRAKKPHHSYLSLAMEIACEDIVFVRYVSRESFDPAPKVDSIVLTFRVKKNRNTQEEQELQSLWKRAFAHPRKTLISNLKQHPEYSIEKISDILEKLGYTTQVRAEAIAIADWKNIIQSL